MSNQTAFGRMLQHLVELTSIVLRPEPLDTKIERRCKQAWEEAPCPECDETATQSGDDSPRIWCTNCRYVFSYTRNTPFKDRSLTLGQTRYCVRSLRRYASQHPPDRPALRGRLRHDSYHDSRGRSRLRARLLPCLGAHSAHHRRPTQIDETGHQCSGSKGQTPPRDGLLLYNIIDIIFRARYHPSTFAR